MAACFAPKGLWYEQSFCSTAAGSVQTVRMQTAYFESQSDPQTHSHEVDGVNLMREPLSKGVIGGV